METEEAMADRLGAVKSFVAGDTRLPAGCSGDHEFDAPGLEAHEVAGAEDAGGAHGAHDVDAAAAEWFIVHGRLPRVDQTHQRWRAAKAAPER